MSAVVLLKCTQYQLEDVRQSVHSVFELLGGIEKFIRPGMKVAVKPNLLMRKKPEEATTTHPLVVQAVVEAVQEAGGEVTIVDSPGGPYTEQMLKSIYTSTGMKSVAAVTGAKLNFDLSEIEIPNPLGKLLKKVTVIKPLVDADVVINLPKLKTHGMMVYTGAVKNMFGAVPGLKKAEYHLRLSNYEDFAHALIDIFLSVKPVLNIMDGVIAMEGHGPSGGTPRNLGVILASEDAFKLDLAALKLINAVPDEIPILKNAIHRGICAGCITENDIQGENIDKYILKDFQMPARNNMKSVRFSDKKVYRLISRMLQPKPIFDHGQCIGCGDCANSCPAKVIQMKDKKPHVDLQGCIRCFCCQELCPKKAVSIYRPFISKFLLEVIKL